MVTTPAPSQHLPRLALATKKTSSEDGALTRRVAAKSSPLLLAAKFGPLAARRGPAHARTRCRARSGPERLLGPPRGPATARGLASATEAHRDRPRRRLPDCSHTPPTRAPAHAAAARHRSPAPPPQVQLFVSAEGRTSTLDVDGALTVGQLKDVIEDESFIPADLQRLSAGGRDLTTGTLEDNELADGSSIELLLNVAGGGEASRYKKSTSKMRWKWKKKRTRRLQRKRRKMRARAK
ncbi:unnamed protein product [Pelagomonas calceolata]|uniref:60S ribosomal protein L41 n=1 Tax=Pelagomonas calceolata TaxID=35677 RepID=A0A8J2T0B2_9STRA|nr:unnamed protein product [Pelagomonas calceolata]